MRVESVRGSSLGDNLGTNPQLHPGPIVVGSNAMAGPSATGICLEGNTTTGQVWKLPSVNGNPTVGSTVNGMVYYDTSRNVARMATELGFLAVGQSQGAANIISVSNTTSETVFHTVVDAGLVGPRIYRWTERFAVSNNSGGNVTYTFRLRYSTITLVFDLVTLANTAYFHGILNAWISAQGTSPSSMFVDIYSVMTRAQTTGPNTPVAATVVVDQVSTTSNIDLSSGFGISSTVQMSVANANAGAGSWGFLLEALAG